MEFEYVTRTEARTVTCPYCGSASGELCTGTRGVRESNHRERVKEYQRVRN
ncbi:hypothetical protein SEA_MINECRAFTSTEVE_1 [Gordonia phage MinecraftSteve]|nr:DNA binding protein [Gordonia phage ShayRa]QFP95167.1 hypothetical protein SEA_MINECRAFTSTEVE_1 [Gordonia phage MinecraftSteve]WIC40096.1 hypothetical protein SEA_BATTLESHIP_1 [Gordonia phage Battleship]